MGQQFEDIEVQNMDLEHSKISLDVQKLTFQGCFEAKMIFINVLEYSLSLIHISEPTGPY